MSANHINPKPELTLIILTYNSGHIIKSCLSNLNFDKYQIIVIDNASKDDTVKTVLADFPQAQLMKLEQNIGYGNGNNTALNEVKTKFALILNPDAIIFEEDIEKILTIMKKDPEIALAGPIILDKYPLVNEELNRKIQEIEKDLATIKDNYYQRIDDYLSVRFVVGAALFMNIAALRKTGFFDKNFFLFYEDDELCLRTVKNGYKNIIVPQAKAFHLAGKSSKSSLRNIFRRSWHLLGWSKLYWKSSRKGKLRAKRSACKLVIVYFIKGIFSLITFNLEKSATNFGACAGSFAYLIGLKAFRKDGTPRG